MIHNQTFLNTNDFFLTISIEKLNVTKLKLIIDIYIKKWFFECDDYEYIKINKQNIIIIINIGKC